MGAGIPGSLENLAILGARIARRSESWKLRARQAAIDAQGLVVSPGFIDMLGIRMALLSDNRAISKCPRGLPRNSGEGASSAPQDCAHAVLFAQLQPELDPIT